MVLTRSYQHITKQLIDLNTKKYEDGGVLYVAHRRR